MDVDDRAAGDHFFRRLRVRVVQDAESPGPPVALEVDVGAVFEQQVDHREVLLGRPDGALAEGEERAVDVLAQGRVSLQQLPRRGHVPRPHRLREGPKVWQCPAGNEIRGQFGRHVIQHADAAAPELAAGVDVGAELQQRVDHRPVATREHDGRGVHLEDRRVDLFPQGGRPGKKLAHRARVAVADGGLERLEVDGDIGRGRRRRDERLDVPLQLRPTGEPVLPRDRALRVGQRQRASGSDADDRVGIAALARLQ